MTRCSTQHSAKKIPPLLDQVGQLDNHVGIDLAGHGDDEMLSLGEVIGDLMVGMGVAVQVGEVADAVGAFEDLSPGGAMVKDPLKVFGLGFVFPAGHLQHQFHHLVSVLVDVAHFFDVGVGDILKKVVKQGGLEQDTVGVIFIIEQDAQRGKAVPELVAAYFTAHSYQGCGFKNVRGKNEVFQEVEIAHCGGSLISTKINIINADGAIFEVSAAVKFRNSDD